MKYKKYLLLLLSAVLFLSFVLSVSAHPGRTDSKGGHYNRKTGEYHYHNGSSAGKNTGGDSDSYSYSHFEGPTADYNSDSNNKNTDYISEEEKSDNAFKLMLTIAGAIIIISLLWWAISTKPQSEPTPQPEITEEDIQKTLDKFLADNRNRMQRAREEQEKIINKRIEQKAGFPDGIYIDGFTFNDTNSTEPYGRATAYINNKDKTLHLFQNCDNAMHPINMLFDTYEMKNFKLCEKCKKSGKYDFYLNYESWYKEYIKMKIADENDDYENI